MSTEAIYVYYRVTPAIRARAIAAARQLLAAIEAHTGLRGRLLQRSDDPLTLMEVYEAVPDCTALLACLDREAARVGLTAGLGFERHTERFVPCA